MNSKFSGFGSTSTSPHGNVPVDEATLVSQLNSLLNSLRIPVPLISPTDLTPRLLIVILESLIGMRIPIVEREDNSQVSKVQNMKIFLGVLETDLLRQDVGLSELDPRRLANGDWEEVVFVARLLCWVGTTLELIKKNEPSVTKPSRRVRPEKAPKPLAEPRPASSVASSSKSQRSAPKARHLSPKSQLDLDAASLFQSGSSTPTLDTRSSYANIPHFSNSPQDDDESCTTFDLDDHSSLQRPFQAGRSPVENGSEDDCTLLSLPNISDSSLEFPEPGDETPRCIHEVRPPSFLLADDDFLPSTPPGRASQGKHWCPAHLTDSCTCDLSISPMQAPPVRYGGYIEEVDEDTEIASFELSRSMSRSTNTTTEWETHEPNVQSIRAEYIRTLQLLTERARLLDHLAQLKKKGSGSYEALFSQAPWLPRSDGAPD